MNEKLLTSKRGEIESYNDIIISSFTTINNKK